MRGIYALLALTTLLISVHIVLYTPQLYERAFKKSGSIYDDTTALKLVEYFTYSRVLDIEITERERNHMSDVKGIIRGLNVVLILLIPGLFFVSRKHDKEQVMKLIKRSTAYGMLLAIPLSLLLGFFQQSFAGFHYTFFPQGNYEFSSTSTLIMTFPQDFFYIMLTYILLVYLVLSLLFMLLAHLALASKQ
ncbi:DUF1461 domain-containing protein [Candidatus Woesearchaeota archaeon]|nr:DUF1461 domain-containing protein [Candidatus Woesearchaeota archaeon]